MAALFFSVNHPLTTTSTHHKLFTTPVVNHRLRLLPCMASARREPLFKRVTTFSPATIAHFGSSFEKLGCAVEGLGDFVTLMTDPDVPPGDILIISDVDLDVKQLQETLSGFVSSSTMGFSVSIISKGVPTGVGLGSTAATINAAALAVNEMFGGALSKKALIGAVLDAARKQAYRLNLVPAMVGNFVGYNPGLGEAPLPWGLSRIIYPRNKPIWFVFVIPQIDAEIPSVLELTSLHAIQGDISFMYNGKPSTTGDERNHSLMTLGVEDGDLQVLGTGMSNNLSLKNILYPFIPGFYAVKEAAIAENVNLIKIRGPIC